MLEQVYLATQQITSNPNSSYCSVLPSKRAIEDGYGSPKNIKADNLKLDVNILNENISPLSISIKDGGYLLEMITPEFDQIKVLAIRDMVEKVKNVLGLSHVQIASIVGVSRPSLYNHINEKETPKSSDGYKRLFEIAEGIDANNAGSLKKGLKSVLVEGRTLLSYLKDQDTGTEKIIDVALEISKKLSRRSSDTISKADQLAAVRQNSQMG